MQSSKNTEFSFYLGIHHFSFSQNPQRFILFCGTRSPLLGTSPICVCKILHDLYDFVKTARQKLKWKNRCGHSQVSFSYPGLGQTDIGRNQRNHCSKSFWNYTILFLAFNLFAAPRSKIWLLSDKMRNNWFFHSRSGKNRVQRQQEVKEVIIGSVSPLEIFMTSHQNEHT